jgi:hypothetical protein
MRLLDKIAEMRRALPADEKNRFRLVVGCFTMRELEEEMTNGCYVSCNKDDCDSIFGLDFRVSDCRHLLAIELTESK